MPQSHDGHRARMRERFAQNGLSGFSDHEIIELLLFGIIPRKDVNALARTLVAEFGSVYGVLTAPSAELERVDGIGKGAATQLAAIGAVARECMIKPEGAKILLNTPERARDYLVRLMTGIPNERIYMLLLDSKFRLIKSVLIAKGDASSASIDSREAVRSAVNMGAAAAIFAHNHPAGTFEPSASDITATRALETLCSVINVKFVEHYIIVENGAYAIKARKQLALPRKPELVAAESGNMLGDPYKEAERLASMDEEALEATIAALMNRLGVEESEL